MVSEKPNKCMCKLRRKFLRACQKSAKELWVEKVYDSVIACSRLKGKISQMKVVEDFESRPLKAVTFVVEKEKSIQEWSEQKLPKVFPGKSGGRLPGEKLGAKSPKKWLRASRRRRVRRKMSESQEVGSKRTGEKKKVQCEILDYQEE